MAIPTYVKNVARSFGYAISDTIKDYNPVIDNLLSDSKSVTEDLFTSIGSFKDDVMSGSEKSLKEEIRDSARDIWDNFKDDIRSGNLYQRDKKDPLVNMVASAMGMDFDLDMDFDMEDWGDDDWNADDSQKAEVETSTKNTKATIEAMDLATDRIIKGVTSVQAQSTDYLAHVTRSGNKAMYDLNRRGFNNISKALLGVNKSITAIAQLGKPLTDHMQNSTLFFTKTTESLEAIKNSLANIEKNTAPRTTTRSGSRRSNTFSDIFDEDSGLNISSYIDMVKENFGDYKWMTEGLINGVKNLKNARSGGSFGKNISLTTLTMQLVTKALIPNAIVTAMKGFNESLKAGLGAGLIKFRDKSTGNFALDLIKEIFMPSNEVQLKLKTNRYEKGPVSWDGIARKALTETIPGYLRMIYSAITGEDRVYDYDRGQFRDMKSVRSDWNKLRKNAIASGGGDFRKEAIQKLAANRGIDLNDKSKSAEIRAIEADVDKFFEGAIFGTDEQRSGYHNFKDTKKLRELMGVTPEVMEAFLAVIAESNATKRNGDKKTKRGLGNRMITGVEAARNNWNRSIKDMEENGVSVYLNDVNGSTRISGSGVFSAFSSAINSIATVIPSYLAMILANQQVQLGARGMGKKAKGVYAYYDYKSGKWSKSVNVGGVNIGTATDREGETKGSTGGNNNKASSSDDDGGPGNYSTWYEDELTPKEEKEAVEKTQSNFMKSLKETKIGQMLTRAYNWTSGKFKNFFKATEESPGVIGSATRLINSLTYTVDTMFFGKKDGDPNSITEVLKKGIQNVFDSFKDFYEKHLKEHFDKFAKWLNDKFPGLSEFGKMVKGKLKGYGDSTKKWLRGKLFGIYGDNTESVANTPESKHDAQVKAIMKAVEDGNYSQMGMEEALAAVEASQNRQMDLNDFFPDSMAKGGTVKKTGLAILSKGELVIPSEYNPYYNGPTNKASQMAAEKNIENKYFGRYAKGGIVGKGLELGAEGFGQFFSFLGQFFGKAKTKDGKEEEKTLASKLKMLTKAAFGGEDSTDNLASMAAGGLIGGGVSLLTGAVVGPLFGAAIGAGAGLIINSKKVQEVLFGKDVVDEEGNIVSHKNGILPEKVAQFMQKQLPDMAKGAGVGAAAGLFFGSPVVGAVVGGAVGFVKTSEKAQEFLFGKQNEDGTYKEGLIPKEIQDKFKKGLPRAIAGAGIGLLAGPFGLVGNMVVGAGIGFMTTSEKFHETIMNAGNALSGFITRSATDIYDKLHDFLFGNGSDKKGLLNIIKDKLVGNDKDGKPGLLNKLFGGLFRVGSGLIGIPMGIVNAYGAHRKTKNITKGYDVFDKSLGRNMTAAERNRERNRLHLTERQAGNYRFDEFLQSLKSQDELDELTTALASGDASYKGFDLSKYSRGQRKNLSKLVNSERAAFNTEGVRIQEEIKFHSNMSKWVGGLYNVLVLGKRPPRVKKSRVTAAEANGLAGMEGYNAPQEGDTKTETNWLGRPIKYVFHNNEWEIDKTDKESDEAEKETKGVLNTFSHIPIIGTGFSKLTGLLGSIKEGLFGDGEKKKGLLGTIKDALFGEDGESGFLGGLFSFFTGGKGLGSVKNIISKFAAGAKVVAIDVGIFAALGVLLSNKFSDLIHSILPNFGQSHNTTTTAQTTDGRTVTRDSSGNWIDESGNTVSISDIDSSTVSNTRNDVYNVRDRLLGNFARGTVTGSGSVIGSMLGRTSAANAIRNAARSTNFYGVLSTGGAVTDATFDALSAAARSDVSLYLAKIAEGLKKVPILNKYMTDDLIDDMLYRNEKSLGKVLMKKLSKESLESFAQIAGTALIVLKVALIINDFTTGYEDARNTLGIFQEPTVPQRLISGLLRVIKNLIPIVGTLIPDSLVVDVFCNFVAPIFGMSGSELMRQREESQLILEQYNAAHGTDLTTEQFIKDVMHDYTWTERAGNAIRSDWNTYKVMTSQLISDVREYGIGGAVANRVNRFENTFADAYIAEGKGLAGGLAGLSAGIEEALPSSLGDVLARKVDIWKLAVAGKPSEMWKVTLKMMQGGGEDIEGTNLKTVGPGIFTRIIGQMPLIMTKVMASPVAMLSWSFHKMLEKLGLDEKFRKSTGQISDVVLGSLKAVKDGDVGRLLTLNKGVETDEENPLGNVAKGVSIMSTSLLLLPTLYSKAIHMVVDKVGPFVKKAVKVGKDTVDVYKTLWGAAKTGEVGKLMEASKKIKQDKDDLYTPYQKTLTSTATIVLTPITLLVKAGKFIGDQIKNFMPRMRAIGDIVSPMWDSAKEGDLSGIADVVEGVQDYDDNPLGKFAKVVATGSAVVMTPIALVKKAGNIIGEKVDSITGKIKEDTGDLKESFDNYDDLSDDGSFKSLGKIWSDDSYDPSEGPLQKIYKTVNFFGKIFYTITGLISLVGNKINKKIGELREEYEWVDDLFTGAESVKDTVSDAASTVSNTVSSGWNALTSGHNYIGDYLDNYFGTSDVGSGSGFVSQLDPRFKGMRIGGQSTAANGCAPAVASMIANRYGKSYSMQSASRDAGYYQNGGAGTSIDYFADSLSSRGINVGSINSGAGVYNSLASGNPVVLLGQDSGNGSKAFSPFGPNNHYVMASGLDRSGNIVVNDPEANGPRSYRPSAVLRGVRAALGTAGSGSRLRNISGARRIRLNTSIRNKFRRLRGGSSDDRSTIYAYLKSKGMSDYGISGLMGCWQAESGNRPDRVEGDYMRRFPGFDTVMASSANLDNYTVNILFDQYDKDGLGINKNAYLGSDGHYYPGFGLAQWTGGRGYKLLSYAKEHNLDWRTLEAQLEYAWHEMQTSYSNTLSKLNSATSIDEAAQIAYTNYEGCGTNYTTDKFGKRLNAAYDIYNSYSGSTASFMGFSSSQSSMGSSFLSNTPIGTLFNAAVSGVSSLKDRWAERKRSSQGGALGALKGLFSSIFNGALSGDVSGSVNTFLNGSTASTSTGFTSSGTTTHNNSWLTSSSSSTPGTAQYSGVGSNGVTAINNFPYFNQNDEPWKNVMYSYNNDPSATIQTSGCGPTSGAMILKSYGINTNPIEMADYAFKNGFRPYGGTSGGFFPSVGGAYGLDVQNFQDVNTAKQMLMNNIPLVALMKKGDFTGGGHYVVISGYDPATDTFTVNDSNSRPRSEKMWEWSKMGQNATNFWAFSKDGVGSIGSYKGADSMGSAKSGLSGGSSGLYNTRAGSALRRWRKSNKKYSGGASGIGTNRGTAASTTVNIPNIDAIMNRATAKSANGSVSPTVLYELLAAIAQILITIAGNTGTSAKVTDMLATYLPRLEAATGLSSDQLKAGIEQARVTAQLAQKAVKNDYPENANLNDVDTSVKSLSSILSYIAT